MHLVQAYRKINIITWTSRKSKDSPISTMVAELLGCYESADLGLYIASFVNSMLFYRAQHGVAVTIVNDQLGMLASITSQCTTLVQSKQMIARIYVLRRLLDEEYLTALEWGPSDLNIADPLTKSSNADSLIIACSKNLLTLPTCTESGRKRAKKFKYLLNAPPITTDETEW